MGTSEALAAERVEEEEQNRQEGEAHGEPKARVEERGTRRSFEQKQLEPP